MSLSGITIIEATDISPSCKMVCEEKTYTYHQTYIQYRRPIKPQNSVFWLYGLAQSFEHAPSFFDNQQKYI